MNLDNLMAKILEIIPRAVVDERDGEIVILTGLAIADSDNNLQQLGGN